MRTLIALLLSVGCAYEAPLAPPPSLTIETMSLPNARVGSPYAVSLIAAGGRAVRTWTGTGLPPELALSSDGAISGTPLREGRFELEVSVTDGSAAAIRNLTLAIDPVPAITTESLPRGRVGESYAATFSATGVEGAVEWRLAAGALAPGLAFDGGAISGTPVRDGSFDLSVRATDARVLSVEKSYTLVIDPVAHVPIALRPSPIPTATVGAPFSTMISADEGTGIDYAWTIESGLLPTGLSLEPSGTPSTRVLGTPTEAGNFTALIRVTDSTGESASATFVFEVYARIMIETAVLPDALVDSPYSHTLSASGGRGALTWRILGGQLPDGLALAGAEISGTAVMRGASDVLFEVEDEASQRATVLLTLTVHTEPTITTVSLPNGFVGELYAQTITAIADRPPFTWTIASGTLPSGLTFFSDGTASSAIFGTPTDLGSHAFEVSIIDAGGAEARAQLSIDVDTRPIIVAPTSIELDLCTTSTIDQLLTVTGGDPPFSWSAAALPNGLLFEPLGAQAHLRGRPSDGFHRIMVTVTDDGGVTDRIEVSLTVAPREVLISGYLDGSSGLFYADLCGSTPGPAIRVSPANLGFFAPEISPDRTRALYYPDSSPQRMLVAAIDTATIAAPIQVSVDTQGDVSRSYWSPDGTRLVYEAGTFEPFLGPQYRLYYTDLTNPAAPTPGVAIGPATGFAGLNLTWLPDGSGVVFTWSDSGVYHGYHVDLSTGVPSAPQDVAPGMTVTANPDYFAKAFAAATDSSGLLFIACEAVCRLHYVSIASGSLGTPVMISGTTVFEWEIAEFGFSPDGARFYYVSLELSASTFGMYLADLVNGVPQPSILATADVPYGGGAVQWTSSPERILVRSSYNLLSFDPSITPLNPVVINPGPIETTPLAISPDETKVAFAADLNFDALYEIFVADTSGSAPWSPTAVSPANVGTSRLVWSPDGRALAIQLCVLSPPPLNLCNLTPTQLDIVAMDGPNAFVPQLASLPSFMGASVVNEWVWTRGSRSIAFVAEMNTFFNPPAMAQFDAWWVDVSGLNPGAPVRLHPADLPHPNGWGPTLYVR